MKKLMMIAALVALASLGLPAVAQSAEAHRSTTVAVQADAGPAPVTQRGAFVLATFEAQAICDAKAPPFAPKTPPGKGGGKKKCSTADAGSDTTLAKFAKKAKKAKTASYWQAPTVT